MTSEEPAAPATEPELELENAVVQYSGQPDKGNNYVYSDKARLSVVVQGIEHGSSAVLDDRGELHAYYHCDYLGTTDYLTSAVDSRVIAWTSYSEWGEISHNAVLKCGQRELDLVKEYATHDMGGSVHFRSPHAISISVPIINILHVIKYSYQRSMQNDST